MAMSQAALIALGSNMGDRLGYLRGAVAALAEAGVEVVAVSGVYETAPMYVLEQPAFYNACALIRTERGPHALLALLHEVEARLGRVRAQDKGPRTLDLDLLAYEDAVICDGALELPHPGMEARHFVLAPLAEVAPPGWRHPVRGTSVRELLNACPRDPTLVRLDAAI